MLKKEELREILRKDLASTIGAVNGMLRGADLHVIEKTLSRLGRGNKLPLSRVRQPK